MKRYPGGARSWTVTEPRSLSISMLPPESTASRLLAQHNFDIATAPNVPLKHLLQESICMFAAMYATLLSACQEVWRWAQQIEIGCSGVFLIDTHCDILSQNPGRLM